MCDSVRVAGTLLPCREVLIASGQLSAAHLCQNSYAGQELKELKSLIAIASRNPLCRNNYMNKIPFSLAFYFVVYFIHQYKVYLSCHHCIQNQQHFAAKDTLNRYEKWTPGINSGG